MTPNLEGQMRELRRRTDVKSRDDWDRSLPFADALFDRWERAQSLGFGQGSSIYDSALVIGDVRVGSNTWIGPGTILDGSGGGLVIGDFCDISAGAHIYSHDTSLRCVSLGAAEVHRSPVRIGDGTYVGPQSIISAGLIIGSRCVVGANSFVREDVADRMVVAGSPARKIGEVQGTGADIRIVT